MFDSVTDPVLSEAWLWFQRRLGLAGSDVVRIYARNVRVSKATSFLTNCDRPFDVEAQGHHLRFVNLRGAYCTMTLEGETVTSEDLSQGWATECPTFVMAWLGDSDYDKWQNAQDPILYTSAGLQVPSNLVSNGFPPPLEALVVDTAKNPARMTFQKDHIAAIGASMLLGSTFWTRTGAKLEDVAAVKEVEVEMAANGITRVLARAGLFTTAEGEAGRIQVALRKALFPNEGPSAF